MEGDSVHVREVTVNLEAGLHMTPLSQIVQLVQKFNCKMQIYKGDKSADATSMLDLMTLGAECGARLSIHATGAQAEPALAAVVQLFEANFETGLSR